MRNILKKILNKKKEHPKDWEKFKNEENKFQKYFKENL